jgi:glycosyltransferase involved in cell wall biosynthesis
MVALSTARAMENNGKDLPRLGGVTVLQVVPALETGGVERTALEVGRAIVEAGGRSLVASAGGPMVSELEAGGSRHVELPLASKNPVVMAANRRRLARLIRFEGVSLVHARSRAPAWSAYGAARDAGVPFVTTYHGIYSGRTRTKILYNSVMARGDRVIANSAYTAEAIRTTYGAKAYFDAGGLRTIPRGADLSRFDGALLDAARRDAALAAFGGRDAFRILLPGRLSPWKGQRELILAAGILQRSGELPRLRVVMTGSAQGRDDYLAGLKQAVATEGLDEVVHIHGHWEDMPAAYDWADLTVSASTRPEAFGRVAIEAQAMACPVVATAHGGSLETVDAGTTGYLVPPGDADALAEAIVMVAKMSPEVRDTMGQQARDRARANFSTQAMTAATLSVYKELLNPSDSVPSDQRQ